MAYVDGFVLPVPKNERDADRKRAHKAGKIRKEYGALDCVECVADGVKPGKRTSFAQAVKRKFDEVVAFSWIVYRSRAHRDKVNKQAMAGPRLACAPEDMPLDTESMFWGGFKSFVRL